MRQPTAWVISFAMLAGLAAIATALWWMWPPLGLLFIGCVVCLVAMANYVSQKEKR